MHLRLEMRQEDDWAVDSASKTGDKVIEQHTVDLKLEMRIPEQ